MRFPHCLRWFGLVLVGAILSTNCGGKKTTRKITIEGPEKKTEVKIEKTEKD